MQIKSFFDTDTATFTYIIIDEDSKNCAVVDSVLNFELRSGKVSSNSADEVISYIKYFSKSQDSTTTFSVSSNALHSSILPS